MPPKKLDESKYSVPTQLIYGKSVTSAWDYTHHVNPPITASSTFRLDSASRGATGFGEIGLGAEHPIYVYERMGEPNVDMLQHALATAEGGECCVAFSSGMAAVNAATLAFLQTGDEILSHRTIYGCSYSLFSSWYKKLGIKTTFLDLTKPETIAPNVNKKTRIVYLESPANPSLELLDLDAIIAAVKSINAKRPAEEQILTVMDNTFATPFAQRPISHGVDIVLHSLTKGISGFGAILGGAVITRKEYQEKLIIFRKDFGGTLIPHTAWTVLLYGLSTLSLRLPKQQENAMKIATFLESHPKVEKVRYPGLPSFPQFTLAHRMLRDYEGKFAPGFMLYFTLKGSSPENSKNKGEAMMDFIAQNAYTITLAVSLGQLRTLIEHPGSMTHAAYPVNEQIKLGIDPGGIRLAVGIESPEDIIRDLESALASV